MFIINICIIPYMHFQHYSLSNKISFKISFQCSLKLFGQKVPWNFLQSSMELFEQHLNNICGSMEFHGIPWNFVQIQSSMEFHGTFSTLPSSMEFHGTFSFPQKSSMEFHGIPWNFFWSSMEFHGIPWNLINFIFKKIIFLNIVFGIWLMIRCYLAKISQKRYKLHCFNIVIRILNTPVSAKMAQGQRKWHVVIDKRPIISLSRCNGFILLLKSIASCFATCMCIGNYPSCANGRYNVTQKATMCTPDVYVSSENDISYIEQKIFMYCIVSTLM